MRWLLLSVFLTALQVRGVAEDDHKVTIYTVVFDGAKESYKKLPQLSDLNFEDLASGELTRLDRYLRILKCSYVPEKKECPFIVGASKLAQLFSSSIVLDKPSSQAVDVWVDPSILPSKATHFTVSIQGVNSEKISSVNVEVKDKAGGAFQIPCSDVPIGGYTVVMFSVWPHGVPGPLGRKGVSSNLSDVIFIAIDYR